MNNKPVFVLFLLALVVLVGIPESFARPQYLTKYIEANIGINVEYVGNIDAILNYAM